MEEINNNNSVSQSINNSVPEPVQPSTSHNSLSTKTNGFLVSLLSILLLLAVSAAGFFAYQTQSLVKQLRVVSEEKNTILPTPNSPLPTNTDPTANSETYTNEKYSFSFKYPNTGTVYETAKRDSLLLGGASFILNYKEEEFRPQKSTIYVYVYENTDLDLRKWLSNNSTTQPFGSEPVKEFYKYTESGNINIGNYSGIKFSSESMGFVSNNVAIKKDDFVYVIGNVKVADDLTDQYEKILSTFKFI